jgi:hippurate hydrolase
MAFIGVSPHSGDPSRNYPLHNTKMTADEAAMARGAAIHAAFAEKFLNDGFATGT